MTRIEIEENAADRREKRAISIAAMGLVNRVGGRFLVSTPSLRGKQTSFEVKRDTQAMIRCNCLEFEEMAVKDPSFRCEHILAVKFALAQRNSEPVMKQKVSNQTETDSSKSENGEQKENKMTVKTLASGQVETEKVKDSSITDNLGEITMKTQSIQDTTFMGTEETEIVQPRNNVVKMKFKSTPRNSQQDMNLELKIQSDPWKDRIGSPGQIDHIEWHAVADILDKKAPNWSHAVKDIKQFGNIITVTVAITVDGITREGLGTGYADSEVGIKKAEHDALKRAAVKFGVARGFSKRESDVTEREEDVPPESISNSNLNGFPANPVATSLMDLVTAKQLGMIRAITREMEIDADGECQTILSCETNELSKKAASAFIQHLQDLQSPQDLAIQQSFGKVG